MNNLKCLKQLCKHLRIALLLLLVLGGVCKLSADNNNSYTLVVSDNASFKNVGTNNHTVEIPMIAALYRNDKAVGTAHTKDNSRWQVSLKYDDPRWSSLKDGTVYWYIKSNDGTYIYPSSTTNMDDGNDNSASTASAPHRMLYKSVSASTSNSGPSSYFYATKGKFDGNAGTSTSGNGAVSCTFAYSTAGYENSSNYGASLDYSANSVQYWRNLYGIKFSTTYNASDVTSYDGLPAYSGTYCYVKKPSGWSNIAVWAWDSSVSGDAAAAQRSAVKYWPGEVLKEEVTGESGATYYLWKMSSSESSAPDKIIFNNGVSNTMTQTATWAFTNGGVYDASSSSNYLLGTAKKETKSSTADQYEKFYAYGFWGETTASWKEMDPVIYYKDKTKNEIDSVVFYTTISKSKGNSFDDFFLMFASQRYMETWSDWTTGVGTGAWDFVWRPEIFDNRDCNALYGALYQAGNDLRAIKGQDNNNKDAGGGSVYSGSKLTNVPNGDTKESYCGKNQMQTLNPLLTDKEKQDYDSYILSLNVTTGTYAIKFQEAIKIVGPAVKKGTNYTTTTTINTSTNTSTTEITSAEKDCGSWSTDNAITLRPSDDGSYYYTTVTLVAGKKFRFIQNKSYDINYGEDGDDPSTDSKITFARSADNMDVSFYNHLTKNTPTSYTKPTGGNTETSGVPGIDITFRQEGLSDNDEYETEIRFYPSYPSDIVRHGTTAPFYTIDRPITFYNYGTDSKKGYTSFACCYPLAITNTENTVNVYGAEDYDKDNNQLTLYERRSEFTHTNTYKTKTYYYIPANVGLILAKSQTTTTDTIHARVLLDKLNETVTEDGFLKPVTNTSTKIEFTTPSSSTKTGDPVTSRQYLFAWQKATGADTYSLAFLRSKTGTSIGERAYLTLKGDEIGATTLNPQDDAAFQRTEGITIPTSSYAAKENMIKIFFEGSTPTGILMPTFNRVSNDPYYYTIMGQRITVPLQPGIYIHQGKKVIVK